MFDLGSVTWIYRCCAELFLAFSLNYLSGSITHNTRRHAAPFHCSEQFLYLRSWVRQLVNTCVHKISSVYRAVALNSDVLCVRNCTVWRYCSVVFTDRVVESNNKNIIIIVL